MTNTLNEAEKASLHSWLKVPENQKVFKQHVKDYNFLNLTTTKVNTAKALQKVLNKVEPSSKIRTRAKVRKFPYWLRYAAILGGLSIISYGFYLFNMVDSSRQNPQTQIPQITLRLEDGSIQILDVQQEKVIANKDGDEIVTHQFDKISYKQAKPKDGKLVYNELTVPYGKKFQVVLSDGTHVFLNSGTKIRYPIAFISKGNREVFLDGEAYFLVTENKVNPFVVNTDEMNVQVLGTKFVVSSYQNENNTSATLVEGSVAVYETGKTYNKTESIVIEPNQQVSYESEQFVVREVNVKKYTAWTEGKLYFVNDRFEVILKEMERHFNVEIVNNYDRLNGVRYTATFKTETIEQILNTFKENTQFEYHIEENKIMINEP